MDDKTGNTNKKSRPRLQRKNKRVDMYSHFSFLSLIDFLESSGGLHTKMARKLFSNLPGMLDIEQRLQLMDKHGVEMNVLIPSPLDVDPKVAEEGSRICNDELAKIIASHPERFCGVAQLPDTNPEVMMAEFERAIKELDLVGSYVLASPAKKRLDHPDYEPLYRRSAELDVPIWIHPMRPPNFADYVDENVSKYQVWQTLGWIMDSSTAMVRIVFSGVFERYPNLKIIIHHHGALIPLFERRLQKNWDSFEQFGGEEYSTSLSKPYIHHFKNFYCDTVTFGFDPLLLQRAYDFFGADHLMFGTDTPFDGGGSTIPDIVKSVEALALSEEEEEKIFSGNALRLLKRT